MSTTSTDDGWSDWDEAVEEEKCQCLFCDIFLDLNEMIKHMLVHSFDLKKLVLDNGELNAISIINQLRSGNKVNFDDFTQDFTVEDLPSMEIKLEKEVRELKGPTLIKSNLTNMRPVVEDDPLIMFCLNM